MVFHSFHPSVTEQSLFRNKHTSGKLKYLSYRFLIIFLLVIGSISSHQSYCRNPHKHIIEPQSIVIRTVTCKCTVGQTIFLIHDKVKIIIYQGLELQILVFHLCLHHGSTYSTGIIQCMRGKYLQHLWIGCTIFLIHLLEIWSYFGEKIKPVIYIFPISFIACSISSCQHSRISHTPFVTCQTESTAFKLGIGIHPRIIGNHFPCTLVHNPSRSVFFQIFQYPIHIFLDFLDRRYTITHLIIWL